MGLQSQRVSSRACQHIINVVIQADFDQVDLAIGRGSLVEKARVQRGFAYDDGKKKYGVA